MGGGGDTPKKGWVGTADITTGPMGGDGQRIAWLGRSPEKTQGMWLSCSSCTVELPSWTLEVQRTEVLWGPLGGQRITTYVLPACDTGLNVQ